MPQNDDKRRKRDDQPIAQVIQAWMDEYRHEGKFSQSRIRAVWAQKMGTSINRYTRDLTLVRGKLYLKIDSAPLRDQLTYQRHQIKDMLNRELGKDVVQDVVVR